MVQPTMDSKFSECGLGNTEADLPTHEKQFPSAAKKTPLKDSQNTNIILVGNSALPKDTEHNSDSAKVSGLKRPSPERTVSSSPNQSSSSNATASQLVYVRRKTEAELAQSNTCDITSTSTACLSSKQLGHQEVTNPPRSDVKERKYACFSAFAPSSVATLTSSSGKPSVSLHPGNSNMRTTPAEFKYEPVASTTPSLHNPARNKNLQWEERYRQSQLCLKKLNQTDPEEYVQVLRSMPSVELSRLAVELEKRSIQLSLEEAKEVQRAAVLNVLGKQIKK